MLGLGLSIVLYSMPNEGISAQEALDISMQNHNLIYQLQAISSKLLQNVGMSGFKTVTDCRACRHFEYLYPSKYIYPKDQRLEVLSKQGKWI